MHRVVATVLTALLLLSSGVIVGLCNGANLSAESEIRPGSSVTLRLSLDSASMGYEGYFSYDSSVLELTRIIPANSDLYDEFQVLTESGYVRVHHSEKVKRMLQLTFTVSENAKLGTSTTVRFFSGKVLNDGGTEEIADASFTFFIADRKSSDATLQSLSIAAYRTKEEYDADQNAFYASLTPSFASGTTNYSATVANAFAYVRLQAHPNDSGAVISEISGGELTAGAVNTLSVVVKAEDGTAKIYTVQIFRESMPDTSIDVSYPVSGDPVQESSVADETVSEESFDESILEESFEEDGTNQISIEESHAESSGNTSVSSFVASSADAIDGVRNWTGIFLCIAVVGALALIVLIIRIFVLFTRKQK